MTMPANLPPQYHKVKKHFEAAKTYDEKVRYLKEMMAIMPKHKGTNRLRGDLRAKMAKLQKRAEESSSHKKSSHGFHINKEGAGQVVLIGAPNVGKSSILDAHTNAEPEIALYPFTTNVPIVGMMPFETIQIQMVDTPAITADFIDPYVIELVRNCDVILFVLDLSSDELLEHFEGPQNRLDQSKVTLVWNKECTHQWRKSCMHFIRRSDEPGWVYKKTVLLGNKSDAKGANERLEILRELYGEELPIKTISVKEGKGRDSFKRMIFSALDIIRIYTKSPREKVDLGNPIILEKGSDVLDAAEALHKEFAANLKFARIWGKGRYDGQSIGVNERLNDEEILEFHI